MPAKKPTHLILEFPKDDVRFWVAMLDDTADSEYRVFSNQIAGRLQVTSFSLEDHQFINIRRKRKKTGNESVMWIPRSIVIAIIEGKAAENPFSFAGTAGVTGRS